MSRSAASRSYISTSKSTTTRPRTVKSRPKTGAPSTSYGYFDNDIICAVSEARGVTPSVGLAFVNLSTCEAVLCQFADTQTFARTCHKIKVFSPTEIVYATTATDSKLLCIIKENLEVEKNGTKMTPIHRKYWSELVGHEYLQRLALPEDLEALKLSLTGNYFAVCCFAAVLQYLDLEMSRNFAAESLRIKFESSEGAMMIDLSTIASLELVQNLQQSKSKDCLYGILNQTMTLMGARLLKNNILQPSTDREKIEKRWAAVEELSTKEELFYNLRDALKGLVDTDRALANLVVLPKKLDFSYMEQSVNNILMLKSFLAKIKPIWRALVGASSTELQNIRELCDPVKWVEIQELVEYAISEDVSYSQNATDLRNHRVFAIQAGTNGFLDVARQSYNEFVGDVEHLKEDLQEQYQFAIDLKYDTSRQFFIRIPASQIESPALLPETFINIFRNGKHVECQTLALVKLNQKIKDIHNEIVARSDSSIQLLIAEIRTRLHSLFKISESIALLDLLTSLAHLSTTNDYKHPEISEDILAIKAARHPMLEIIQKEKYIPNDVYATRAHRRFQIITGCNMSGKSVYIRSIALLTIMAQIGSFVPAMYASFPIRHSLFARISTDNYIEANVSTFASEMREMSFILRNVEPQSLVIVDELGRGTSTTDGLSIAIAISEALIQSKAHIWFVTHFRDLPRILAERVGVFNLHMHVDVSPDFSTMKMRYRISEGQEEQKYYGLALAQLVDLPDEVMEVAVAASQYLNTQSDKKKGSARMVALAKRRKLTICLKEMLMQARDGELQGERLLEKMKKMQEEFYVRMAAIEAEYMAAVDAGDTVVTVMNKTGDISRPQTMTMTTTTSVKCEPHSNEMKSERVELSIGTPEFYHASKGTGTMASNRPLLVVTADQNPPSITPSRTHTPRTPNTPSTSSPWQHDNPIFRAMPTNTPTRTMIKKESSDYHSTKAVKEESENMDINIDTHPTSVWAEKGERSDDPICIEDDGMSISTDYSY